MKHKTGNVVAIVKYAKIDNVVGETLQLQDLDDSTNKFQITGKDLTEKLRSANLFEKTEKITLTKAAELVSSTYNTPITVCFDKQDGTERVLVGRLLSSEPLLGRSHYDDLEITNGHRLRQVDHRTLKWAIINNIKYIVKK